MILKNAFRRAAHVIQKSKNVGFQWKGLYSPLKKVREELRELEAEIKASRPNKIKTSNELGDLLFSLCNLATFLEIDAEKALHSTLDKFQSRFTFVERELRKKGKTPKQSTLKEMQALWKKAKKLKK